MWFSAKQIEEWSEMSKKTLWRWLEKLEKARRIATVSYLTQWRMPHEQGGSTPTTLYNLNVLITPRYLLAFCSVSYLKHCKFYPLLKRKELDSKNFTNDEIILGDFKGKESLPLANRGNAFVSLRGVLEILSKTELSSDIVGNFQDEDDTFLTDYRTV